MSDAMTASPSSSSPSSSPPSSVGPVSNTAAPAPTPDSPTTKPQDSVSLSQDDADSPAVSSNKSGVGSIVSNIHDTAKGNTRAPRSAQGPLQPASSAAPTGRPGSPSPQQRTHGSHQPPSTVPLRGGTGSTVESRNKLQHKWPKQTNVHTSVREGQLANGTYTPALTDAINQQKPGGTLSDAAQSVKGKGPKGLGNGKPQSIPGDGQHPGVSFTDDENPTTSKGSNPGGWQKNTPGQEPTQPRYVLLINGEPEDRSDHDDPPKAGSEQADIDKRTGDVEQTLRKNYGNQDAQDGKDADQPGSKSNMTVDRIKHPTPQQLKDAMKRAQDFAKKHPGAEIAIYYAGHGALNTNPDGSPKPQPGATPADQQQGNQGADEGLLLTQLPGPPGPDGQPGGQPTTTTQLKDLFTQYLSGYSDIELLIDACQSGSFAA